MEIFAVCIFHGYVLRQDFCALNFTGASYSVFILQIALDEIASVRSRSICEPHLYYEGEPAPICKKT